MCPFPGLWGRVLDYDVHFTILSPLSVSGAQYWGTRVTVKCLARRLPQWLRIRNHMYT